MKTKNLLKTPIALIALFTLFNMNAAAQDKITFTWQCYSLRNYWFSIDVTKGKEFTINWGDGTIETRIGEEEEIGIGHIYIAEDEYKVTIEAVDADCKFSYFACSGNSINSIDCSGCSSLTFVGCNDNFIKHADFTGCSALETLSIYNTGYQQETESSLNLTGCSSLKSLNCHTGNLLTLDVSDCPVLSRIECRYNRLQLSDLFAMQFVPSRNLGWQELFPQTTIIGEQLFSEQAVFNGIFTEYVVIKDGAPASENDYTVTDGKLTFHAAGYYKVTMTNDAITATFEQADVIAKINVSPVNIPKNDASNIMVYPNPTNEQLIVESGKLRVKNLEILDINGRKHQVASSKQNMEGKIVMDISYLPTGIYFMKIVTEQEDVVRKIVKQ